MTARIQLSRRPGWRLPEGGKSVAYPTKWQNPYKPAVRSLEANLAAVEQYRHHLAARPDLIEAAPAELAPLRYLACWCPLHLPCHADVLIDVAAGAHPLNAGRRSEP